MSINYFYNMTPHIIRKVNKAFQCGQKNKIKSNWLMNWRTSLTTLAKEVIIRNTMGVV